MVIEEVKEYLEKYLPTKGYKLYHYSTSRDGKAIVLHITVDRRQYIDLDTISALTSEIYEELSRLLTIEDELLIDCSSAGIEKELSISELEEYVGEYVYLTTHEAVNKCSSLNGYLKSVSDDKVIIDINVSGRRKDIEVSKSNIAHIRLDVK